MGRFHPVFYWSFAMMFRTVALAAFAMLCAGLAASPGEAGTLYVASDGTGGPPCAITAPCASLFTAVNAAGVGDTVVCLSVPPAGSGNMNITKSITVECSGSRVVVRDSGLTVGSGLFAGVIINIAVSSADPLRTVRLRGLVVDGASPPLAPSLPMADSSTGESISRMLRPSTSRTA
jgi:hypothetical protein